MPADQPWLERQEVPLSPSGLQHGIRINAHLIENDCQLIDEGDVQVTLRVLDDFGGFSNANTLGFVGTGGDNAGLELIDFFCDLGCGARRYLEDIGQAVQFVAGVDPLG